MFTDDEMVFIDGTELALDWNLDIPDEDISKYYELIERRKKMNYSKQIIEELRGVDKKCLIPTIAKEGISEAIECIESQRAEIERLRQITGDDKLYCFVCKLKTHFNEAYTEAFSKTLENQIDKILEEMRLSRLC